MISNHSSTKRPLNTDDVEALLYGAGLFERLVRTYPLRGKSWEKSWDKLKLELKNDSALYESLCDHFIHVFSKKLINFWHQEVEKGRLQEIKRHINFWISQNNLPTDTKVALLVNTLGECIRIRAHLRHNEKDVCCSSIPQSVVNNFFNNVVKGWLDNNPSNQEFLIKTAHEVVAGLANSKSTPVQLAEVQVQGKNPNKMSEIQLPAQVPSKLPVQPTPQAQSVPQAQSTPQVPLAPQAQSTPQVPPVSQDSQKPQIGQTSESLPEKAQVLSATEDSDTLSPVFLPNPDVTTEKTGSPKTEIDASGIAEGEKKNNVDSSTSPSPSGNTEVQNDTPQNIVPELPKVKPALLWKYLPVPEGPDKHTEFDDKTKQSPEGMLILGGRVRGKKHKHEGTNCDDWFEFDTVGKWSIFAVADGGGNYKFSRVGSQAACKGAVSYLVETLREITVIPKKEITADIMNDDDIKAVKEAIHESLRKGWSSIEQALQERENSKSHYKILDHRDLTLRDLYSTLLVCIHTTIETPAGNRSLIFASAAGDGIVAVINGDGDCNLLMKPDSGEFSGEVEFLGPKLLTDASLLTRTYPFAGTIKALMLMTDGVADDYFPNNLRMPELYADLVLNGILPTEHVSNDIIEKQLSETKISDINALRELDCLVECDRLAENPEKVYLMSAAKYADALGIQISDLVKKPGLLAASLEISKRPMPGVNERAERLILWLDSYQVKGSFDDRTLIVMAGDESK